MVDQLSNHLRRQPSYCEEISNQLIANREEITIAMPELAKVLGWKEKPFQDPMNPVKSEWSMHSRRFSQLSAAVIVRSY